MLILIKTGFRSQFLERLDKMVATSSKRPMSTADSGSYIACGDTFLRSFLATQDAEQQLPVGGPQGQLWRSAAILVSSWASWKVRSRRRSLTPDLTLPALSAVSSQRRPSCVRAENGGHLVSERRTAAILCPSGERRPSCVRAENGRPLVSEENGDRVCRSVEARVRSVVILASEIAAMLATVIIIR